MMNPARAGPMARETLTPTRSSLEAARSSDLGTISGTCRRPSGQLHGRADAQQEGEGDQQRRRHLPCGGEHSEQNADDEEIDLNREQQPASVEGVGEDSAG